MKIRLTYFGWMVTRRLAGTGQLRLGTSPENDLLLDLWTGALAPASGSAAEGHLLSNGMIEQVDDETSQEQTLLRGRRNPFEHLTKVIFEFTTLCNFNCAHCYNGPVKRQTETNPGRLAEAAKIFLQMGIRRFDFIGGEVSLYGNGWLDLARQIRSNGDDLIISLFTNGWWLGQTHFKAAGKNYASSLAYLDDLKCHGVSHIAFSLDGPEDTHDLSRRQPGLYRRVMEGLAQVREAGLEPRVSILIRPEWGETLIEQFLAEPATIIYQLDPCLPAIKRALHILDDATNATSHFIDIGNGARDEGLQFPILDKLPYTLHCRNFYRLRPSLTVKASGELAACRLGSAGEGYGNLHEQSLVDILNRFDEAFIYQLHAGRGLEAYLPLVDRHIFGQAFTHTCTLRSIVTLLARKMHEQGVDFADRERIQQISHEVAHLTGHLPA